MQNLDLQVNALKAVGYKSKESMRTRRAGRRPSSPAWREREPTCDPMNSVKDICRTLEISRVTLSRDLAEQKRR